MLCATSHLTVSARPAYTRLHGERNGVPLLSTAPAGSRLGQGETDDRPTFGASCVTVIELLLAASARCPEKPVLTFEDGLTLTRRQFVDRVESFAATLEPAVRAGDRVAVMMGNRAEFLIAALAVIAHRAAFVPVDPAAGDLDGFHVLEASRAVAAVADPAGATRLEGWRSRLAHLRTTFVVDGPEPDGLPSATGRIPLGRAACEAGDIVAVPFTSGTTGTPKGCLMDHVRILTNIEMAMHVHAYGPSDRIFYPVQFFYLDALNALVRALWCDGTFIAARRFSVSRFWGTVHDHNVTIISTIASMPVWLLKTPPDPRDRTSHVRFAVHSQVPRDLHEELDRRWGFPWLENYGMTESGLIARVPVELADELRGTGSTGPIVPSRRVRIQDANGSEVPTGDVGEIVVQGPGMFRGYLDDPEATQRIVRDGWLYTGDLGRIDERGFLYVSGRKKDIVRRSGENVNPEEVEAVLRSYPGILDAAVTGVPDVDRGEELEAHLQLRSDTPAPAPEDIARFCAERLAHHKVPRYIRFVPELPMNASMRVRKELLRIGKPHDDAWDQAEKR